MTSSRAQAGAQRQTIIRGTVYLVKHKSKMALRIIHRQWQRHFLPSLHTTARCQAGLPFSSIPFDGVNRIIPGAGSESSSRQASTALVSEIEPIIADHYDLCHSNESHMAEEKAIRYDLAVAHRLTAKYGMDMLVWNHISARYRTGCLITPGRKMWGQINPEDLVYSSSNVTADVIHDAVYSARPDIKAIIHLHTPAATAISCLEEGFQPIIQVSRLSECLPSF